MGQRAGGNYGDYFSVASNPSRALSCCFRIQNLTVILVKSLAAANRASATAVVDAALDTIRSFRVHRAILVVRVCGVFLKPHSDTRDASPVAR